MFIRSLLAISFAYRKQTKKYFFYNYVTQGKCNSVNVKMKHRVKDCNFFIVMEVQHPVTPTENNCSKDFKLSVISIF